SMVAEVVPENRRVEAGAILQTASPMGLFLATFVTYQVTAAYADDPTVSWRYVFLFGLIPAAAALLIRFFIREPDRWENLGRRHNARIRELFSPQYLRLTISGLTVACIALITWWSCNAFISVVAKGLAHQAAMQIGGLDATAIELMGQQWIRTATSSFNLGSLIGALLTIPTAKLLGRRKMFFIYFASAAISIAAAFGTDLDPHTRLFMYFPIGLATSGVFGCFVFYLPELFPTRLRGTGAGFTFNSGRVFAAVGPILVGSIAARGTDALESALSILIWVSLVPVIGILLLPCVIETKVKILMD
ncbi:MAG: MFS transporter, partial [Methylococcales bacterium]